MKINRALNLVISVDGMFVHSTPISREIFEAYYKVLAKTHATIFSEGLGIVSGPGIAYLALKDMALEMRAWDDVQAGLINEIVRLSNVMIAGDAGWQMVPLQIAIDQKKIDEDSIAEVMGQLVFFTCVSKVLRANLGTEMMTAAAALWGSEVTALSCTDYRSSLPISTAVENTGATAST